MWHASDQQAYTASSPGRYKLNDDDLLRLTEIKMANYTKYHWGQGESEIQYAASELCMIWKMFHR